MSVGGSKRNTLRKMLNCYNQFIPGQIFISSVFLTQDGCSSELNEDKYMMFKRNPYLKLPVSKAIEVSMITCGLMNCQSVNEKKSAYLSNLILKNNYQCVALTETWLDVKGDINSVVLSSFRGDGVGFVYKNNFHARLDASFEFSSF